MTVQILIKRKETWIFKNGHIIRNIFILAINQNKRDLGFAMAIIQILDKKNDVRVIIGISITFLKQMNENK